MRGIHKICKPVLLDFIISYDRDGEFYKDIFELHGLDYSVETVRQKRVFVAAVTEYFVIKRCKFIKKVVVEEFGQKYKKYDCNNTPEIRREIAKTFASYFKIREKCLDKTSLLSKYAELYKETVRDFSKEISMNRDDMLSDFAKAVEKLYYSREDEQI